MHKGRLEAFSDGVIAILITIMVIELHAPDGTDAAALTHWASHHLPPYLLSFAFLGLYWNNHHHMLQAAHRVNGRILIANLHLLFWLSLVPVVTAWIRTGESVPAAAYGGVALFSGLAYLLLQRAIIAEHGPESALATAVGPDRKGMASAILYAAAIPLAFWQVRLSYAIYVLVPVMWFLPDPRIESKLKK